MSSLCQNGASSNSNRINWCYAIAGSMAAVAASFGDTQAQNLPLDDLFTAPPPEAVETVPEEEVETPRFELPDTAEPESASRFFLDVREELRFSDNPDLEFDDAAEDVLTARTVLEGGYISRTSIDTFELLFGVDLDLRSRDSNDNAGIQRPTVSINWDRDVGNARFGLNLGYSEFDLGTDTGTFFNEDTDSIDFGTIDQGTRQTTDIGFDGGFGLERPFGGNYLVSQRQIRYSDTEDPDLLDADRFTAEGDIFFVLSPRITAGLEAGYIDFDEEGEGAIDTVTTFYSAFADTQINSRLSGRFSLGWEEVEDTGAVNTTEDGVVFGVDLTQETPRGENLLELGSIITSAGRRNEVRIGQRFEQSTRQLGYSVGLSDTEGSDVRPLFGLNWVEELPRGTFNVSLEQTPFTDRDTGSQINTLFTFGYVQDLTTRSGIGVDLSYLNVNELGTGEADTQRLDLSLTYRYALTEDWDLTSGISLVRADEDGAESRDSNTIFIGLGRRFVWN